MNDISTYSTHLTPPLTFDAIHQAIRKAKKDFPNVAREIRIRERDVITGLFNEKDDKLIKPLLALFGIPVVVDSEIPYNKIKIIYNDGREELFNV